MTVQMKKHPQKRKKYPHKLCSSLILVRIIYFVRKSFVEKVSGGGESRNQGLLSSLIRWFDSSIKETLDYHRLIKIFSVIQIPSVGTLISLSYHHWLEKLFTNLWPDEPPRFWFNFPRVFRVGWQVAGRFSTLITSILQHTSAYVSIRQHT
jgi:hypothetical protein